MEITEKKQTPPILSSFGGAESAFGEPKDGPWKKVPKHCNWEVESWRFVRSSMETRAPKWKSWFNPVLDLFGASHGEFYVLQNIRSGCSCCILLKPASNGCHLL